MVFVKALCAFSKYFLRASARLLTGITASGGWLSAGSLATLHGFSGRCLGWIHFLVVMIFCRRGVVLCTILLIFCRLFVWLTRFCICHSFSNLKIKWYFSPEVKTIFSIIYIIFPWISNRLCAGKQKEVLSSTANFQIIRFFSVNSDKDTKTVNSFWIS